MTTYYVATNGNNVAHGGESSPWRTINYALQQDLQPGDEIVVRAGTYTELVLVRKDGAAGQYITVRSEVPGGAKIVAPDGQPGVTINADYVTVAGFDVSGSTGSGITGIGVHHVKVANNIVHDNLSNGIFLGKSDFIQIDGNTVYGNAAMGASSGIHLKAGFNVTGDLTAGTRVYVTNNVVYDNTTAEGQPMTDGNGISIDDYRNTQIATLPAYAFRTLVQGNIVYDNSGRGVQVAWSDHVTVRENLAFHNSTHAISGPWRGDLANMGSNDTAWINNIAVTNPVNATNTAIANVSFAGDPANVGVSWSGNTTFNGTPGTYSIYSNSTNSRPQAATNHLGVIQA